MKFQIHDEAGDLITVVPATANGVTARIAIAFTELDEDGDEGDTVTMVLDDRLVADLKQALNHCVAYVRRVG